MDWDDFVAGVIFGLIPGFVFLIAARIGLLVEDVIDYFSGE